MMTQELMPPRRPVTLPKVSTSAIAKSVWAMRQQRHAEALGRLGHPFAGLAPVAPATCQLAMKFGQRQLIDAAPIARRQSLAALHRQRHGVFVEIGDPHLIRVEGLGLYAAVGQRHDDARGLAAEFGARRCDRLLLALLDGICRTKRLTAMSGVSQRWR